MVRVKRYQLDIGGRPEVVHEYDTMAEALAHEAEIHDQDHGTDTVTWIEEDTDE